VLETYQPQPPPSEGVGVNGGKGRGRGGGIYRKIRGGTVKFRVSGEEELAEVVELVRGVVGGGGG
jgi:hypothetical protein